MTMSDTLGDMLTRIRNGQQSRQLSISSPASKFRVNVLEVLLREGYIRGYSSEELSPGIKQLKIEKSRPLGTSGRTAREVTL